MFDISWGELVLIGMVALIVIGPKELPTVLRTVGQWMTKIRRMAAEFQGQFQDAMREAELDQLKKQVEDIADPTKDFSVYNPLETAKKEVESAFADADKPPVAAAVDVPVSEPPALPFELGGPPPPDAAPPPPPSEALAPAGAPEPAAADAAVKPEPALAQAEPAAAPAGPPPSASEGGRAA